MHHYVKPKLLEDRLFSTTPYHDPKKRPDSQDVLSKCQIKSNFIVCVYLVVSNFSFYFAETFTEF
jgi:hypothetical protein